eukprot:364703-Chlamydomonas_euryale.AAC.12
MELVLPPTGWVQAAVPSPAAQPDIMPTSLGSACLGTACLKARAPPASRLLEGVTVAFLGVQHVLWNHKPKPIGS